MNKIYSRLLIVCALTTFATLAHADVLIFDSFAGPSPGYDPNVSIGIGLGGDTKVARSFEVTSSTYLTSIQLAMFGFLDPATFNLSVYGDDGHNHPGSAIESFIGDFPIDDNAIITFNSVLNPLLTSGTYYLVVNNRTGIGGWDFSGDHHIHSIQSFSGSGWSNNANHIDVAARAFGSATPVPEPASLSILAVGFGAMMIKRRSRTR